MSSNFIVEQQDGITTIRLLRRLSVDEFFQMMDEVAALDTGGRRLWDTTNRLNYTTDEIRQIAERGKRVWTEPAHVAFVAADDLTFGQVRMFEAFRDQEGYRTRVFRDEQAARDWLLATPD